MRYLKKLLLALLVYDGVFYAAVAAVNIAGGTVQDSVIAAVSAASAVELIIGGVIKRAECSDERKRIKLEHTLETEENRKDG